MTHDKETHDVSGDHFEESKVLKAESLVEAESGSSSDNQGSASCVSSIINLLKTIIGSGTSPELYVLVA